MKPYDPKLREAMIEIEAICNKYDIVGTCFLLSASHAEFLNKINASWNVLSTEARPDGRVGLRLRSKLEDFNGDKKKQHEATEATAHCVTSLIQWTNNTNQLFKMILAEMRKNMTVLYETWGERPDSVPGDGL